MATYESIRYEIEDGSLVAADFADGAITAAKLNSTLDISGKTITLPNASVTNAMLAGSIDLTSKVTGTLPVANGGTGVTSLGSAGQVLRVNSGATALEFGAVSAGLLQVKTFRKTGGFTISGNSELTFPSPMDGNDGITPSATNSIIGVKFWCNINHGTTWRSHKMIIQYSTNGGSSWTDLVESTCSNWNDGTNMQADMTKMFGLIPNQNTTNEHKIRIRDNGHNSGKTTNGYGQSDETNDGGGGTVLGTGTSMTLYEFSGSSTTVSSVG